jgi:hypothetical protein
MWLGSVQQLQQNLDQVLAGSGVEVIVEVV